MAAPPMPTRCPSCGAKVELMRLNLSESMLSCCSTDCIWPLEEEDADAFVVGAPPAEQFAAGAFGAAAAAAAVTGPRKKRKRHCDEPLPAAQPTLAAHSLPQPLPAAAAAAVVDGRASPAASPIRSPEFAAAQEWRATAELGEPPLKASEDDDSMMPMGSMMAGPAPSADDGLVLSPQLTAHKAPSKDSGAGGIDLQGALDELDALLELDDDAL